MKYSRPWRMNEATGIAHGWLSKTEISFGIQNLFNKSPPTLASQFVGTNTAHMAIRRLRRLR